MITVQINSGLGNQMFQYALGRVLSLKNNTTLGLDVEAFNQKFPDGAVRRYGLGVFSVAGEIIGREKIPLLYRSYGFYVDKLTRFLFVRTLKVPGAEKKAYHFDERVLRYSDGSYLQGYWQSYKYFLGYEDVIRADFQLKKPVSEKTALLASEIAAKQSVCLHVRRGDFVNNPYHNILSESYHSEALSYLAEKITIDTVYVFSDDIAWCKKNIHLSHNTVFVGDEYAGEHAEEHLFLMAQCKHFVIPNSTFSWWAAWLASYNEKIVIAPKEWFAGADTTDLIPPSWIRL